MSKKFDSLVMITVFTPNKKRLAELDAIIDAGFAMDGRTRAVRAVGYASRETFAAMLDGLVEPITAVGALIRKPLASATRKRSRHR